MGEIKKNDGCNGDVIFRNSFGQKCMVLFTIEGSSRSSSFVATRLFRSAIAESISSCVVARSSCFSMSDSAVFVFSDFSESAAICSI